MCLFIFPHISVWGSSFVGCHPARIRPSFPPSSSPPPPLTHSLTHSLAHSLTHSLAPLTHSTHSLHSLTHSLTPLTHSLTPLTHSLTHSLHSLTPALSGRRGCGARGRRWGPGSLCSVQRLQKGLRRAWSPLGARLSLQCPETAEGAAARVVAAGGPALSAVSGAVSRDCRRGCDARGRRWGPLRFCALLPL